MKDKANATNEPILIGRIVASFGLRGQVKVLPLSNIPERFAVGATLILDGEPRKIVDSRLQKTTYILRLEGVKKIEEAEALKWKELFARPDDRPDLDDDEYMVDDLIGMHVVTVDGRALGEVDEVLTYPAHDILVVGELMIPAVQEFIELVDFDEDKITVRLIEGMESSEEA